MSERKTLWGGRFKKGMSPKFRDFSYSLATDFELLDVEIQVDIAWVRMLGRTKFLKSKETSRLVCALQAIGKQLRAAASDRGGLPQAYVSRYEDIHTCIQTLLEKKVGTVAKKIHTGRSRNDLIVTSCRLYLRAKVRQILQLLTRLQKALLQTAEKAGDAVISGMTHLRRAQPVLVAHHLLAYVEMIEEDRSRFQDSLRRLDVLPLGSAALAGSSLTVDQRFLARQLGFSRIATNSLAVVSDRSFVTECLACLGILWVHLSRLAEDFILWNSEAFGFIELDDAYASGSSLMPQKKNPDVFELVRGRSGVIFGHLLSLLVVQKGLPLAYNRDLQEDKPALFDALRKTELALDVLSKTIASVTFRQKALRDSVADDFLFATDILEYLVQKGMAFSDAHELVGRIIRYATEHGRSLRQFELPEWKRFSKYFCPDIYGLFDPAVSVAAKKTIGSTNPKRVRTELQRWKRRLRK